MNRPGGAPTRDQLLARFSPAHQELAEQIRSIVVSTLGDPEERVNLGWVGLAYHDAKAGYLCGIFPRSDGVRLLFEHGAALDDTDGLLDGGGSQTRFLTLRPGETIPEEGIRRMIHRAVQYGAARGKRRRR